MTFHHTNAALDTADRALDEVLTNPTPSGGDRLTAAMEGLLDAMERDAEVRHEQLKQDIVDELASRVGLDADRYLRLFGADDLGKVLNARTRLRRASHGRRTESIAATIDRVL